KVIAVAQNMELLQKLKEEIDEKGGECSIYSTDITSEENVKALAAFVEANYKRVDVLINNAGINRRAYLCEMDKADWDATIAVNLTAGFLCLKHFSLMMKKQKKGKIINIASIMATAAAAKAGPYCASKGGVQQLTRTAALELAGDNIQVNAIAPGYFITEINEP
ncbi:MAG: SDR family oxidoreductase, partial [Clostridiales bacterium]